MSEVQPVALLVEDEPQVRHFVRAALEAEGWRVFEADSMKRGLIDAASRRPDLVIVDLGLPDGDGIHVVLRIRQWSPMPIIILSARTDEQDKIRGLDAGADDYLTKPFAVGELLARVRAALRRRYRPESGAGGMIEFGDVRVDLQARLVIKGQETVHLTPTEYRLLAVMINHAGRVVTNAQLLREVWGPAHAEDGHYVRIYMGHLRQKLENDPTRPRHIVTEPAVGYRLLLPV
ncbi:MAG: two-component system response regulator KdpE [Burkholderiaceae bacterium]